MNIRLALAAALIGFAAQALAARDEASLVSARVCPASSNDLDISGVVC
jgi:hypothetical protein